MRKSKQKAPTALFPDLHERLIKSADFKEISPLGQDGELSIWFYETLVNKSDLEKFLLMPIARQEVNLTPEVLQSFGATAAEDEEMVAQGLFIGSYAIFLKGSNQAWLLKWSKDNQRAIMEPFNEVVVRGSHDGFTENLDTNLNLVRQRIKSGDLCVKYLHLGGKTKSKTAIVYMRDIANQALIDEIERRLSYIKADMVMSPGYIEEFIEDDPFTIFPQMVNTERPDRVIANIVEGRVAIIAQGSPTALIVPTTFFTYYQSPDDYNSRWIPATFIRLLRYASFIIAITLPSMYIAIVAFHLEVIPQDLILPLKASVEGIPYQPLLEAIFMEITIELIREAGIRLPKPIGQTIGIVGGLVIGDAVVNAGMISNIMIVVVALTAISSYVVPSNEMSTTVRLIRFPLMVLASVLGFVGVTFGLIFIFVKLCKMESFGVPYLSPLAPFHKKDLKDTLFRFPLWMMNNRPKNAFAKNRKRQSLSRGWEQNE